MFLPYVYKLSNDSSGEYYFGYRYQNVRFQRLPLNDIGKYYFTSSKYIKPIFDQFKIEILSTYQSREEAYDVEQQLISEHIKNPKCLNRHYQFDNQRGKFFNKGPHSEIAKQKMRGTRGKINRVAPGHTSWNKGLTKETDHRLAIMAEKRKQFGNPHQLGKIHSEERISKVRKALVGRKIPPEQLAKMSIAKKGKPWEEIFGTDGASIRRQSRPKGKDNVLSKPIMTDKGKFDSITQAMISFNITDQTVRNRCSSSKWINWYYITKENDDQ